MSETKHVDIKVATNGHQSKVVIDGVDWSSAITAVDLRTAVGEISTVTLKLPLRDVGSVTGDARVVVTPFTASLLKALGWTPPDGAA